MDIVEGKFKQLLGSFLQRRGNRRDNDLDRIEGSRYQLLGLTQERNGYARAGRKRPADGPLSRGGHRERAQ